MSPQGPLYIIKLRAIEPEKRVLCSQENLQLLGPSIQLYLRNCVIIIAECGF